MDELVFTNMGSTPEITASSACSKYTLTSFFSF